MGDKSRKSHDKKWFVINEPHEKSFCTVPEEDVICEEGVKVGDEVHFFWNKRIYSGFVKYISDDFDKCSVTAVQLNAKSKQESFERKAAAAKDDTCLQSKFGRAVRKCNRVPGPLEGSSCSSNEVKGKDKKNGKKEEEARKRQMNSVSLKRVVDAVALNSAAAKQFKPDDVVYL